MSALSEILDHFRTASVTEREKGTYFEELMICYLRNEASYRDLYSDVWTYTEWAKSQGLDGRDTGIDLVAKTSGTDEYHAIQCKLYAEDYKLQKRDIDSFFTASGKKPFKHRIIVSTTNHWSEHAEDALRDQQPPVSKIDLHDLENSQIEWSTYKSQSTPTLKLKYPLRPHQATALNAVKRGLSNVDRGKLIMACGTGKTFTSLKIAEELAGKGKRVLFLVPSLSLLSQTLTEWTQQSKTLLHSFAVCSDSAVGKKRKKEDDSVQTFTHELRYPATTEASKLAREVNQRHDAQHMSVVFSTYHSIDVISDAQLEHGLDDFDLIICDEAHRTTGAIFDGDDESAFVRVHDGDLIRGHKRLYMTATPRIYSDAVEVQADQDKVKLFGMNDEKVFGKELHVLTFSEAVKRGLLVDYKVIVLAIEESHVSRRIQSLLKDEDNQLKVDDAAKIIGCWKALSKQGLEEDLKLDPNAMKRAVAFCQVIELNKTSRTHKVSSKQISSMFQAVVDAYQASDDEAASYKLRCESQHVDGSMNASEKEAKLNWLKAEPADDTCRVLSNVRCLSEGVDVPALDAVLFLTPRSSQVDVVQSVGRVMRNAPGKERGYVIMPVVIPVGVEAHEALNDNKTYKVVWQVLQALRSHDDRFDAMVNKLDLIGRDTNKMEVIAITDKIQKKQSKTKGSTNSEAGKGRYSIGSKNKKPPQEDQGELAFEIGEVEKAIYAKLVSKVGNRHHWEDWANDIAKIARTHIDRIAGILEDPDNKEEKAAFDAFAEELRDDLNDSITDEEIIEMLAQHLVTKPVFDALFEGHSFAEQNPMSQAMQAVLDALHDHHIGKEADTLQAFYESVKLRAEGIDNAAGKQKIVVELYDKFFRNAFPRMTERLGIVYTPVEVVDFIIHSVNDVLQSEFGQTLGSKGVHIIDPFTGTGTFITRLLQSGLIKPEELPHKYSNEIHANEIVLLAYYIAAINIEAVYHSILGGEYRPFEGICLTDTFQMYEKEDLVDVLLEDNSARRKRQKALDIRVIMGNPPYSAGQESANDNNANIGYPHLDSRIRSTYAEKTTSTNKNALYDSYIRAIRWASDRIGDSGVIGFVTNAGFIESGSADGLRKCLADEFSNIYIFHLRGNARTSGEQRRKEKDNVFGSGSRAPIAITILVKNLTAAKNGQIYFHGVDDYLSREQKLELISEYGSINGISVTSGWQKIIPDNYGDWLNQRDDSFYDYLTVGSKLKDFNERTLFSNYSRGLETGRDVWIYNASKENVLSNIQRTINVYNKELERFHLTHGNKTKILKAKLVGDFINTNGALISWTRGLRNDLVTKKKAEFDKKKVVQSIYRPFTKQYAYFDRMLNAYVNQIYKIFPNQNLDNLVIYLSGAGKSGKDFSALIVDCIPDLNMQHSGGQGFPLYLYEPTELEPYDSQSSDHDSSQGSLFDEPKKDSNNSQYNRKDALTDVSFSYFQSAYPNENISKEDVFYYTYGLLHSEDYLERFADNLSKELPRIPAVKRAEDFWAFSKAGRELAELHLNYETVELYPAKVAGGSKAEDYRVEKMKYGKAKDKTTLHYNNKITVTDIPLEAYDYVVNGKPALDWVVERQCVKTDKDSGIVNDANDWAIETMNNPRYPLELFLRVITVSLETMKIVRSLPTLDI